MDYPYRLSLHVYMDDVMDPIQHRLIKGCRYYTFGGGGGGGVKLKIITLVTRSCMSFSILVNLLLNTP